MLPLIAYFSPKVKTVLRPLYHLGFRVQLRVWCFLDDYAHLKRNRENKIPPAMLRFRVGESINSTEFLNVGKRCACMIEEHLHDVGNTLASGMRILDFGCGCGRVVRWLMMQAPSADFYGVDVDEEAINWCSQNLKGAHFQTTSPDPPLPYSGEFFDAIYCISVFTHLNEDMQDAWLEELRRILKPGGILIFTVHGKVAAEVLDPDERDDLRANGFLYHQSDKLKGIVPSWYHSTWHTEGYVVQRTSRWFSCVEYRVVPDSGQDVVRCRI